VLEPSCRIWEHLTAVQIPVVTGPAIVPTPSSPKPPPETDEFPLPTRVARALARRFPLLHRSVNWTRARAAHLLRQLAPRALARRTGASWRALAAGAAALAARRREPRLTVAVDITAFWEPLTGIGWYLYRLLEQTAGRDDLRLRLYGPTSVTSPDLAPPVVDLPVGPALELVSRRVPDDLLFPEGPTTRLLRALEPLLIALDGNEVLFAPNFFLPRRFLLARGARVTTVHDLGLRLVPETLQTETLTAMRDRFDHHLFDSARIITVSAAVRDELVALRYAQAERIHVVQHGPGQLAAIEAGALPAGLPERFALHVGTLEPRKNIAVLIETWRQARQRLADCPALVLCGKYGWKSGPIRAAVEAASREGWLHHLGYVGDAELAALYQQASLVVFPTRYEGFGLPAIEALWARTPLVCSDLPVLRETTGGAALFAPADEPAAFAACVERVLTDPALRADLVARGAARVAELSWRRSASATVEVWRQAAGRAASRGAS
jgi:glycosyltransferase involved in cell wall biosynthesis